MTARGEVRCQSWVEFPLDEPIAKSIILTIPGFLNAMPGSQIAGANSFSRIWAVRAGHS